MWMWTLIEQCGQDLRYSLAGLRRNPWFALSAIAMLALGITAVTVCFSILDAVLLRPSSFLHPDSVMQITQWQNDRKEWTPVPPALYEALRARRDLFADVVAKRRAMLTVTRVPAPDQMFGEMVTANLFSQLPALPLYGRTLQPSDDALAAPPVLLLSYSAWQQLFAGDSKVVGKTADVDGKPATVIGVMPETFVMPGRPGQLWLPLRLTAADMDSAHAAWVEALAIRRPGVNAAAAQAALKGMAGVLRATPWQAEDKPTRDTVLWLGLGTVAGLLLIGCANVSSLLLARGLSRRRDYAIRIATGASHGRLMRQSFLEALLLSLTGLVLALAFSAASGHWLRESLNAPALGIPDIAHARIDFRIVAFSFAVSAGCALLAAGLPAWLIASLTLSDGLRESGTHSATGHRVRRLMFGLTGVQAGICMALLLLSGLLIDSLLRLTREDHGMRADHVLTARLPFGSWFPAARTPADRAQQTRRYLNLLARVQTLQGVTAAALSSSLPLSNVTVSTHMQTPSETARADSPLMLIQTRAVSRDYFRTMGISLLAGRTFGVADSSKVAIVNQAFAARYFRGVNPVGRFLRGESGTDPGQIIGVIRNTAQLDLREAPVPELYVGFEQTLLTPFLTGLVVRTTAAPEALAPALRSVIAQEDGRQPVVKVRTLRSLIDDNTALNHSSAWLISLFALIALALSSAGIYGVVSFATLARRRDFGIRLCLGSTRGGIFRMAAVQALAPVGLGVLAGVGAAWFFSHAIASLLYKATLFDVTPALSSLFVLLSAAFAAAAIPAWRSARLDPARTLRDG